MKTSTALFIAAALGLSSPAFATGFAHQQDIRYAGQTSDSRIRPALSGLLPAQERWKGHFEKASGVQTALISYRN